MSSHKVCAAVDIGPVVSRQSADPAATMGGLPLMEGKTAVPEHATEDKPARLVMPDGTETELPILLGAFGDKFLDIRKLLAM